MAEGDYIVLADHDDIVTENALYECAKAVNENPGADVLYSDEDKLDMDGGALFDPHFKPDFNPDLLTSVNYICHLFLAKRELVEKTGGFCQEFDGAQDYDFIFRCTEQAERDRPHPHGAYITGAVTRIPRPATRRASSMPLRQEPAPLWPIMSGWG